MLTVRKTNDLVRNVLLGIYELEDQRYTEKVAELMQRHILWTFCHRGETFAHGARLFESMSTSPLNPPPNLPEESHEEFDQVLIHRNNLRYEYNMFSQYLEWLSELCGSAQGFRDVLPEPLAEVGGLLEHYPHRVKTPGWVFEENSGHMRRFVRITDKMLVYVGLRYVL